jgi:hypothetical protein
MNPENEKKLSELLDFLLNNGNLIVEQLPDFAKEVLMYGKECATFGLWIGVGLFITFLISGLISFCSFEEGKEGLGVITLFVSIFSGIIGSICLLGNSYTLWEIAYHPNIYLLNMLR